MPASWPRMATATCSQPKGNAGQESLGHSCARLRVPTYEYTPLANHFRGGRHHAAQHDGQFGCDRTHDTAEHWQPLVGDPAGHAGNRNGSERFAAIVVDDGSDA